ncbi:MAG: sugar phosphate isomerase/epimerase [Planctomycetota bacterium]|nr:sugar phosphate isomerase/epimerase [Planctomycetota bacterium]
MRFGFNMLLWTTFVEPEHAPVIRWLKELGYDGVEIPSGDGPVDHYHTVRKLADDAGLACTAIAMATPEADPTSPDPAVRQAALDRIKSRIECAAILGSPVLGGPLYAAHKQFHDELPGDEEFKRSAEVLAQAADFAEEAGVTLCLEPLNRFEVQLVNTTADARRIVDLTGHPRVAIHYDTHHAHIEEGSHEGAFETCGDHLGHVHFSESHRGTLGTGLVDWAAVGKGLATSGYDDWCVVESFGTYVDGLRQAANVHRNCFESREEVAEKALAFMRSCTGR